jgi:hypothetical protein
MITSMSVAVHISNALRNYKQNNAETSANYYCILLMVINILPTDASIIN